MRVVTTMHKAGFDVYGKRWIDGKLKWPEGTEFHFYTEGYEVPYSPGEEDLIESAGMCGDKRHWMQRYELNDLPEFVEWKMKHAGYIPPDWRFDVVKYACKVFAAVNSFRDYDGIGVWLDGDCVTYKDIPPGLIEKQVEDAYLACYQRTGLYTETGLWIVDCRHPEHKAFMDAFTGVYLTERYKALQAWHDCMVLDYTISNFRDRIKVRNLSGEFSKHPHPQAMTELGAYIDHAKGTRKIAGRSPENKHREAA
jgi:hypothetical protein